MSERQKGVKALNPLTILYLVIALAVVSAIFDYRVTLATVVVMIVIAASAGEGVSFIPGEEVLWEFWVLQIKMESVQKAIVLCSRIMGIGSAILLGGKLIDIKKLMVMLEKRGMSPSATYVLVSTTNIIPQMSKKMNAILEAQKSRGIETDSNIIVRAKAFFPSVGPLILNSLVSAEERAITLEARAFSLPCKKTTLKVVEDTQTDRIIRGLMIAAVVLAIGGKIVLWIVFR